MRSPEPLHPVVVEEYQFGDLPPSLRFTCVTTGHWITWGDSSDVLVATGYADLDALCDGGRHVHAPALPDEDL